MQNKLNEILELCIEKSSEENNVFYYFKYNPILNHISIEKEDYAGNVLPFKRGDRSVSFYINNGLVDLALEYMQNE